MPPRSITILCLLQIMFLVMAWMLAGKYLKVAESLTAWDGDSVADIRAYHKWVVFYRSWIILFFLIPAGVAFAGTRWSCIEGRNAVAEPRAFWLALAMTAAVTLFVLFIVAQAMSVPMKPVRLLM